MTTYRKAFSNRHVLLPVIHVESTRQALGNVAIALDAGCDGVFLINHSGDTQELVETYHSVRERYPTSWIGLNYLGREPRCIFADIPASVSGLWVDNALIDERNESQPNAEQVLAARAASTWRGLYFGGVAFKYQRQVTALSAAARVAKRYMDVVTTSGPGTGSAAPLEKIAALREGLEDFPLAIASGITPANVVQYLGLADCFLVATGISRSWTELDPVLVRELVRAVRDR